MVTGSLMVGKLKNVSFWFALALVGQAVTLQMIGAGQLIRYQHYKPISHLITGMFSLPIDLYSCSVCSCM